MVFRGGYGGDLQSLRFDRHRRVLCHAIGDDTLAAFFRASNEERRPSSLHYRYSDRYAYGVQPLASSPPSFFPSSLVNLAPSTRSVPI